MDPPIDPIPVDPALRNLAPAPSLQQRPDMRNQYLDSPSNPRLSSSWPWQAPREGVPVMGVGMNLPARTQGGGDWHKKYSMASNSDLIQVPPNSYTPSTPATNLYITPYSSPVPLGGGMRRMSHAGPSSFHERYDANRNAISSSPPSNNQSTIPNTHIELDNAGRNDVEQAHIGQDYIEQHNDHQEHMEQGYSRQDLVEQSNMNWNHTYSSPYSDRPPAPPVFHRSPPGHDYEATPTIDDSRTEFEEATTGLRRKSRDNTSYDDILGQRDDNDNYFSDADSDYDNFREDMEKFQKEVLQLKNLNVNFDIDDETSILDESGLLNESSSRPPRGRGRRRGRPPSRGGRGRGRGDGLGRGRKRIGRQGPTSRGRGQHKGPRRAAEPTGDIKLRLSQASQLFLEEKYEEAKVIVKEIIRLNAETHEAFTLLASIYKEEDDMERAITSLLIAAHLRPKHISAWMACANFAREETGDDRPKFLKHAHFCYGRVIGLERKNVEAHFGKAECLHELGNFKTALSVYKTILKLSPHNVEALRVVAEICIEEENTSTAKAFYKESIEHFRALPFSYQPVFSWSDADTYVELYAYDGQWERAIKELKSLARWLLGRAEEEYWNEVIDNDCEWDIDNSRRIEVSGFEVGKFYDYSYGLGLPLEFRVKLGLYRLNLGHNEEALRHLESFDPSNETGENQVLDNSYLCRHVGDQLLRAGLYKEALKFYEPLEDILDENTAALHIQKGKCYLGEDLEEDAEKSLQTALALEKIFNEANPDTPDTEAHIELAKLFERRKEPEKASALMGKAMAIREKKHPKKSKKRKLKGLGKRKERKTPNESNSTRIPNGLAPQRSIERSSYLKGIREAQQARQAERLNEGEHLQAQYYILKSKHEAMANGDAEATKSWINAAMQLTDDFRTIKSFYPWDRHIVFEGYGSEERLQAETYLDPDGTAPGDRFARAKTAKKALVSSVGIPAHYRGIDFQSWLDIFLEYAICLAKNGENREAYNICEAAKDAIIYYHSKEDRFLIQVCWCMCALILNDEESLVNAARYFLRDYQFLNDSYRMFSVLTRMCHAPVSWYSSGPTQKFILRQIRAMDYSLVDHKDDEKEKYLYERGSYSSRDENGNPIINDDLDINLLMIYGFILYTSGSCIQALNYFLRCYALDPDNPMINLSVGLAYLHHSLKRQTENRQHAVLQGFTFIFRYYDLRKDSENTEERLEAHFNVARAYHQLGLVHLALPYYWMVLKENTAEAKENIVVEVAYNLQTIYSAAGNIELAQEVTRQWLVL